MWQASGTRRLGAELDVPQRQVAAMGSHPKQPKQTDSPSPTPSDRIKWCRITPDPSRPLTPRRVAVYYYRSQHYHLGDAKCWVDDNERGAVTLKGYWAKQYNVAV